MNQQIQKVIALQIEKNSSLEIFVNKLIPDSSKAIKINSQPIHGKLEVIKDKIIYIPMMDFIGDDFFTYKDNNGDGIVVLSVKDTVFKPRARLLIQLGDQLIKNESIALVELVKNSYDADSSKCTITMKSVEHKETGVIIVEDNGFGMDMETIKNSWLEPGSNNKEVLVENKIVTPIFNRLPIGEKGIGRFGVHKLGKKIELISRKAGRKEVVVQINWSEFEKFKYLDDAPVTVYERDAEFFLGEKTGTIIKITDLTKNWTRGMVRDVYRAINAISTPETYDIEELLEKNITKPKTDKIDIFKTEFITDQKKWIADIPSWKEIVEYALYYFDIEINGDTITKFKYQFRPWDVMKKISGRIVTENELPISNLLDITEIDKRKAIPLTIPPNTKIGSLKFKGCIFTRDLPTLRLAGIQPNSLKDYLDDNGGIRIYRNGIRVYDYGEKENDWLALDYRRFNDPGVKISNNLLLASINIDREASKDLIEKTNREGFIDNAAYEIFKNQIIYSLKLIELLRVEDKRRVDNVFKPVKNSEPVLQSIENLKNLVNEKVKNPELKKELGVYVDRIEKNYKAMNDTLIKSASAGLGWSVYIHEVEKIISEIIKVLKKENASDRLLKLSAHLSGLIENYSQILRKTSRSDENLKKVIDQALFNVEFRLKAHNIELVSTYNEGNNLNVKVAKNLVIANIMNIIDNSIYWLDRAGREKKQILIDIQLLRKGYISLIIADNGTGFALSPEQMKEPFVSAKPGGMGLGLHIVNEVMESHNGILSFNETEDYNVPDEFKNGSIVILNFKI